jgi:heat shock protein HslJ
MGRKDAAAGRKGHVPSVVLLVAFLLAPLLAACGPGSPVPTVGLTASVRNGTLLAGTEWVLISLNGASLIEGTEINLYFEEAFLGGSMTCNGYGGGSDSGRYAATDDGSLTLPAPIAVTVQHCATPEGVMEQEAAYLEALQTAATYRVVGDRLEISNASGETTLVFAREAEQ